MLCVRPCSGNRVCHTSGGACRQCRKYFKMFQHRFYGSICLSFVYGSSLGLGGAGSGEWVPELCPMSGPNSACNCQICLRAEHVERFQDLPLRGYPRPRRQRPLRAWVLELISELFACCFGHLTSA